MNDNPLESETISRITAQLIDSNTKNYITALDEMLNTINSANAPVYLGIVNSLLSKKLTASKSESEDITRIMDKMIDCFTAFLPERMKKFIPNIADIVYMQEKKPENKKLSLLQEFRKIIQETLIKNTKHEIWNNISILIKTGGYKEVPVEGKISQYLLTSLKACSTDEKIKLLKEIAFLIEEQDMQTVLEHFAEDAEYFEDFLLILKFENSTVYQVLLDAIYSEKKHYKQSIITALPDFDTDKIIPYIKDYNWSVTAALIEKRPAIVPRLIKALDNGELGMQRSFFVASAVEQDRIFTNFIEELNLTEEEIATASTKSVLFINKFYETATSESQMLQLCKILTKHHPEDVLGFIKTHENTEGFELFLKTLVKTWRLTGECKSYVVSKYASDGRFFHALISYVDDIEGLLQRYYQSDVSIESLLRRFNPQELITEFHKYKNSEFGAFLIEECIRNTKFEDKDWILAMKLLEQTSSPIRIYTCFLLLKYKPQLKRQVVSFLHRSVGGWIWTEKNSVADLIACLEILGVEGIQLLQGMKRRDVVLLLRRSRGIEKLLRNYLKDKRNLDAETEFLHECLRDV